jgi:hypothetical protein
MRRRLKGASGGCRRTGGKDILLLTTPGGRKKRLRKERPMPTRTELRERLDQIDCDNDKTTTAHRSLIELAGQVLDMVESDGRELSVWEKANLKEAVSELWLGRLRLAWVGLRLALEDPESVAADAVQPAEAAKLADLKLSQYRRALQYLSGYVAWG